MSEGDCPHGRLPRNCEICDRIEREAISCPRCGRKSYDLNDIINRYCGYCHVFVDDVIKKEKANVA